MSQKRKIVILVNGILTRPGDASDWNSKGVTYINAHYFGKGFVAEKLQYWCSPIGRAFGQKKRAQKLCDLISQYIGLGDIILAGHSNGCDVILDALELLNWPQIKHLHLFSGACEADFNKNGLNSALERGDIKKVSVYVAKKDIWLRIARHPLGQLLGYDGTFQFKDIFKMPGSLGYKGPKNLSKEVVKMNVVKVIEEKDFGHSSWWNVNNFVDNIKKIVK